jgi:hypothetical protein
MQTMISACVKNSKVGMGVGPASVYANRNFKAGEIILSPDTTELKQRMYTMQRSYLIQDGDKLDVHHKHTVLDGRLRSTPMPLSDGKMTRPFSLFFAVERPGKDEDGDDEEANLEVSILKPAIKGTFETTLKRSFEDVVFKNGAATASDECPMVGIPIMCNPIAIKEGAKLTCGADELLE